MKTAKARNLILIITAILCFIASALLFNMPSIKADSTPLDVTKYFSMTDTISGELNENGAEFVVGKDSAISLKNKIMINKSASSYAIKTENVESFKVVVKGESANVNGNKNADGNFDKEIVNTITITSESVDYNGKLTNASIDMSAISLILDEEEISVNGSSYDGSTDQYYKLKNVDGYTVVNISFEVESVAQTGTAKLIVESINTDASQSQDTYNQSFKTNAEKTAFAQQTPQKPLVLVKEDLFVKDGAGDLVAVKGQLYQSFKPTIYTVLGDHKQSDLTIELGGEGKGIYTKNSGLVIYANTTMTLKYGEDTIKSYDFKAIDKDLDDQAPKYITWTQDNQAIIGFEQAFKQQLVTDGTYGSADAVYVSLGTNQKLKLPSMQELFSDNLTSYNNLVKTVYYTTPTSTSVSTNSNMEIPLNAPGDYKFYVAVKDENGNEIKSSDFYTVNPNDKNDIIEGDYINYVFSFTVYDNAPIEVKKAPSQGKGYIGVQFTATKFKVVASSFNEQYTLCYSETADGENWVEIPKATTITDKTYDKNGFNYDDVKDINYDGKLTFTPDRIGFYKITCRIESDVTGRFATDTTNVIEVSGKPVVVKPDTKWLQNNVWSVVFLSVGTLCLIGIIVLLCIKPKDEVEED